MKPKSDMTRTQFLVLRCICRSIREHGWQPSMRELADHFGWASPSAAVSHLRALEKKGYIEMPSMAARAIRIKPNWQTYA